MNPKDRAGEAVPKPDRNAVLAQALLDLEDDVHSLTHMANIVASMVNDTLFGSTQRHADDKIVSVIVTDDQRDRFSFAVFNVASRAEALRARVMAAYDEEART